MKKLYKINRQLLIKLRGTSFRPHLEYLTSAGLAPSRGAMQKLQTQALKHVALEDGNDSGSDDLNPFQIEAGKMAADTQVGVIRTAAA